MTRGAGDETYSYGRGEAAVRRRWLHKRLTEMDAANELPTTVSSLYYDGEQSGQWPADAEMLARAQRRAAAAGRTIKKGRTSRQNISDDVQWLIDHDLVQAEAIADLSRHVLDYRADTDLLIAAQRFIRNEPISPWTNRSSPAIISESRSLTAALDPEAERFMILIAPLSGMSGRSYLRHDVLTRIAADTEIGYLGDHNLAGDDIEANVRQSLTDGGWRGPWKRLALTAADAAALPRITKYDDRYKPRRPYESVEAEALGTTELRRRVVEWLTARLPGGFDWTAHERRTRTTRRRLLRQLEGES